MLHVAGTCQRLILDGEPLKVVATTSIIGDVISQVGGEAIDLTTLMSAGPGSAQLPAGSA